jgi:hypothetical protein
MPQFMVADVPLKFWPPYCVCPGDGVWVCSAWPELQTVADNTRRQGEAGTVRESLLTGWLREGGLGSNAVASTKT